MSTLVSPAVDTRPGTDPARTARWVSALVVASILLQRLAVPGTEVALLVPVLLGWCAFAVLHGVAVADPTRMQFFAVALAATGTAVVLQALFVPDRFLSLGSWGLVMATSAPFVLRLVDRRLEVFLLVLRSVVRWGLVLAGGCLVMTASQVAGVGYRDVVGSLVPDSLLLDGFAISYPYSYGSALYRANAWIGLEPSIVSFQLGLAIVAAVLLRRSTVVLAVLGAGLVATASGSGILVVIAGVAVLVGLPRRRVLLRYVLPVTAAAAVLAATPFGAALLGRAGELSVSGSSASLRFTQPYEVLWRPWTAGLGRALWGDGPGASQELISATRIDGLLVPTAAKVFFDYGLLAGAVLAAFLLLCYVGSLSRALAVSLFASLWSIQPGLTTTVLVVPVVVLVSLWSPRRDVQIEDIPFVRRPVSTRR